MKKVLFILTIFFSFLSTFSFSQSQDLPESVSLDDKEFFFVPVQQDVELGSEAAFLAVQGFVPASSDYLSDVTGALQNQGFKANYLRIVALDLESGIHSESLFTSCDKEDGLREFKANPFVDGFWSKNRTYYFLAEKI